MAVIIQLDINTMMAKMKDEIIFINLFGTSHILYHYITESHSIKRSELKSIQIYIFGYVVILQR